MEQIQKTTDYSIFKILHGNRPLNRGHLKKLKKSIEEENELNLHPIIVNKDYEVIDGQHRLQIAKELGIEIYYVKSDTVKDTHLINSNVNQRIFECENYIEYFTVTQRVEDYVRLSSMIKESGLKPKALLTLLLGSVSGALLDFLKTGKFRLPLDKNLDAIFSFYLDFNEYVKDKRIRPYSMFSNFNFTKALRWLFHTNGFDKELFFKKLDSRWFELKPQARAEDWYKLLLSIYNFKNHSKLEDEFTR